MPNNQSNREGLAVEFQINNFKSYFGDQILLKITKPITIIAGPNGEGKTNLLEAMLVGLANFVNRSHKLKRDSFFTKSIEILSEPKIHASLYDLIFTDLTKKGLTKHTSKISYPEHLDPTNIVSLNQEKGTVLMRILKHSDRGKLVKLAEMTTSMTAEFHYFQTSGYNNKLEHLELLYLNPDTELNNFFVKLVGQEFSNQLRDIQGTQRKAEHLRKILEIFPKDEDRLICEIDNGKFEEKYLKDMNFFLTSNLATGAKKECILYILGLLVEEHERKKNWLTMFLIDEIEDGLHIPRQKKFIDALIKAFQENKEIRKHIKIVMTTHSPIIYSELMKYPEYVDVYFAFRNPKESSKIFKSDTVIGDEPMEKRILTELSLNIYELPRKVVFVEGKTDKVFFSNVFEKDIKIFPLAGPNIPKIISELVDSIPLARSKEYFIVVDQNKIKEAKQDAEQLKARGINVGAFDTGFNSLEELIFDVNIDAEKPSEVWSKIGKRVEEFNKKVDRFEETILGMNVETVMKKLEREGKDGLVKFFESLKKKNNFYEVIGENWSQLLKEKSKNKIKQLKNTIEKK